VIAMNAMERSIEEQFEINRARTPTERMEVVYELLDFARWWVPRDPESVRRRQEIREREREQRRETFRRWIADGQPSSDEARRAAANFERWVREAQKSH
jgi:hypothetical protein